MSKKKAQIEINAGYITIDKQFVGFSLRQKRVSSTVVKLAEYDIYYLQNLYTNLSSTSSYFNREHLQVLPPQLSKPK